MPDYPFIENTQMDIHVCICYINEPWMSIRVFLNEWIFRQGYYHGYFNPGVRMNKNLSGKVAVSLRCQGPPLYP